MSDPINTTSGLALDGLTRLEILQELRQQAWIALDINAAQGGANVEKLGEYIRYLSTDIDKLTNEKAEKLKAEGEARFEAERNTAAAAVSVTDTAGPFSQHVELGGNGLLGQIIDKLTAIEKLLKPTVVSGTTLATIAHAVVAVTDRIDSVPDDVKHRAECNRIGRAVAAALREAVGLDAS
ncbi:hypothetical protein [Tsukamurella sp. USMM236]|uniref:hypothetical protein n=1 Tax=Tsukamurella sp. USMM236 TaxID=3081301 RepID=UPI0030160DEA